MTHGMAGSCKVWTKWLSCEANDGIHWHPQCCKFIDSKTAISFATQWKIKRRSSHNSCSKNKCHVATVVPFVLTNAMDFFGLFLYEYYYCKHI